ncbi:MAG: zinc ribbon domain-containing protein [Chloroflexi bacterium]|nr:MAG: zinc ribbon domain-containing protein [Chloroflexota bacterium]
MPIYEYECQVCGEIFEKRQSFHDEPKATCPHGHTDTRRLLAAPAIVFKGSGFYVTDSRGKNSANGNGSNHRGKTETEKKAEKSTEKSKTEA